MSAIDGSERLPRGERDAIFEQLLSDKRAGKPLPRHKLALAARELGHHISTVYRGLTRGHLGRARHPRKRLSNEEQRMFAQCGGNVAAFNRRLQQSYDNPPSESTVRRLVRATFNAAELAFIRRGDKEMRKKQLYTRQWFKQRNVVWQMDTTYTPIHLVRSKTKRKPSWNAKPKKKGSKKRDPRVVRVIEVTIIDCGTRKVVAHEVFVAEAPSSAMAMATLASAIHRHGVPELLIVDNGPEFIADVFARVALAFGFEIQPARPYAPHQKGIIERFFFTKEQELLRRLPHYLKGPRDLAGQLYGATDGYLTVDEFKAVTAEYIAHYNSERPHRSLRGMTPDATWDADDTPLRRIDEQRLWWLLPIGSKPKVYGYGVRVDNEHYYARELSRKWVDRTVEARVMPGESTRIWLSYGEDFVCVARCWKNQPAAAIRTLLSDRDVEQKSMQQLIIETDASAAPDAEVSIDPDAPPTIPLDEELLRRAIEEAQKASQANDDPLDAPSGDEVDEGTGHRPRPPKRKRFGNINRPVDAGSGDGS